MLDRFKSLLAVTLAVGPSLVVGLVMPASASAVMDTEEITVVDGSGDGVYLDTSNHSDSVAITPFKQGVLFAGLDGGGEFDTEPFFWTGSELIQLADIRDGASALDQSKFVVVGEVAFFTATADGNSYSLYRTDGTTAGTTNLGITGWSNMIAGQVGDVLIVNGTHIATSTDTEVYRVTAGGQFAPLDDFNSAGNTEVMGLGVVGDTGFLYVRYGNFSSNDLRMFKTDGTASGTAAITVSSVTPVEFHQTLACGDKLFFRGTGATATDSSDRDELYSINESDSSITLEANLAPGSTNSGQGSRPEPVMCLNGKLVFLARGDTGSGGDQVGKKLYLLNAPGDTTLLKNFGESSSNYTAYYSGQLASASLSGVPYFTIYHGGNPNYGEIWTTDGTASGTSPLIPRGSNPNDMGEVVNKPTRVLSLTSDGTSLYFTGDLYDDGSLSDVPRRGVFQSDGTLEGTELFAYPPIADGQLQFFDPHVYFLAVSNGSVYFAGDSSDSGAEVFEAVIPASVPGAPTLGTITPGDQQLSVAFTAPSSDGGAAITNYEYSTDGGSTFTAMSPVTTASPLVISGLTNGTAYQVQIRAVNSAGSGTASASVAATPVAPASDESDDSGDGDGSGETTDSVPTDDSGETTDSVPTDDSGETTDSVPTDDSGETTDSVPTTQTDSPASSTTAPATAAPTNVPTLVTSSNQELLTASAGSAKIFINGELVEVELVQASEELRRTVAGARTFEQVRALQTLAAEMVSAIQAVLGDGATLPITVTNTSTGATISGLVADPVTGAPLPIPVEDVLLILNENLVLMVGGADGTNNPANIAFDGVLEFGEGGYVAVLAYGLTPGAAGEVVVMSTPQLLDTFTVDTDGGVAAQAAIPTGIAAGEHTVVVAVDGKSASLGFRVLPSGTLPVTGGSSLPSALAVLLAAFGAIGVLLVSRRRPTV